MTVHRTDRVVRGRRVQVPTGARTRTEKRAALALFDRLLRQGRFDLVDALDRGQVTFPEVLYAAQEGRLEQPLVEHLLRRPLRAAVDATLTDPGATTARYRRSFLKLWRLRPALAAQPVRALDGLDWRALRRDAAWASGSDWNHLRRAVSRFLSLYLADKYHPFRRSVLPQIPTAEEQTRMPHIPTDRLLALLAALPPWGRVMAVTFIATGLRWGEYAGLRRGDLGASAVRVFGLSTKKRGRWVQVDPRLFPFVVAAVPALRSYGRWRLAFKTAARTAGLPELHMHDLRHLTGQLLAQQKFTLSAIRDQLGHKTLLMASRYAAYASGSETATALGDALTPLVGAVPVVGRRPA